MKTNVLGIQFDNLTREEARQAVEKFKDASVKTVMITGDHANTAAGQRFSLRSYPQP